MYGNFTSFSNFNTALNSINTPSAIAIPRSTNPAITREQLLWTIAITIILSIVIIIARWQIFKKAGKKPWESLIPIHSGIVEMEIGKIETYWYFLNLLIVIPILGWIAPIFLYFWTNIALSKAFGKGIGFGILLSLIPVIGYPILGFGNAEYQGKED